MACQAVGTSGGHPMARSTPSFQGCPAAVLGPAGRAGAAAVVADGLADRAAYEQGRIVLTRRGRLLADTVARALTE